MVWRRLRQPHLIKLSPCSDNLDSSTLERLKAGYCWKTMWFELKWFITNLKSCSPRIFCRFIFLIEAWKPRKQGVQMCSNNDVDSSSWTWRNICSVWLRVDQPTILFLEKLGNIQQFLRILITIWKFIILIVNFWFKKCEYFDSQKEVCLVVLEYNGIQLGWSVSDRS